MTAKPAEAREDDKYQRLERKLDMLLERQADSAQMAAQVVYIFSAEGPWARLSKQVDIHEKLWQRALGLVGITALIGVWVKVKPYLFMAGR